MLIRFSLLAILSGLLSGLAAYLYGMVFQEALLVDYSEVVPTAAMFISSLIGAVLATAGFAGLMRITPKYGEVIFGFLFALVSFMSIAGVFAAQLPDSDDESFYYLIYGYAIPMHFFPYVAWYTLKPIFIKNK